jgi:ABC-type uncharacterized transport system permease subunit
MKQGRSIFLSVVAVAIANVVTFFTLSDNQSKGVYPIDADSISIPLFDGFFVSVLILMLASLAIFLPKRNGVFIATCTGFCCLSTLLSFSMVLSWADFDHIPIAIAYGFVTSVCIFVAVCIFREWTSNKLLQSTRETHAPEQ